MVNARLLDRRQVDIPCETDEIHLLGIFEHISAVAQSPLPNGTALRRCRSGGLVERNRVSKLLEGYTQNTQNAAALKQARDQDLAVHPGQDIEYVVDSSRQASRSLCSASASVYVAESLAALLNDRPAHSDSQLGFASTPSRALVVYVLLAIR